MPDFTFETTIEPQFRDIDPFGHVNQAVYCSYLEQARTNYWAEIVGIRHDRTPVAIATQEIEYERPIQLGETVTVAQTITGMGESSFDIEYAIRADGTVAATAHVVLIAFDPETETAIPIPEDWRTPIAEYEGLAD
ncbi:MAG: acyl-CoA thioesterase [Halobacteriales archaeon]